MKKEMNGSEKKPYKAPDIYEKKISITGGGCALEPGNTQCENQGYVITFTDMS